MRQNVAVLNRRRSLAVVHQRDLPRRVQVFRLDRDVRRRKVFLLPAFDGVSDGGAASDEYEDRSGKGTSGYQVLHDLKL